jgi:pimeloyl-ACP methyl ester carboxylesterase
VILEADRGGSGDRLFLLLHGLGATRKVWSRLAPLVQGRWIAPDLRGHGASPHAQEYGLRAHAADVAALVHDASEIVIVGHSMGGAVALALASGWFAIRPRHVFGLGIKVAWNEEELAGMRKMATSRPRQFDNREEAVLRYLKVSGLSGLVAPDGAEALAGVVRKDGGWQLAYDPATASVGPPPMRDLIDAARATIHLARGRTDTMMTLEQLAAYDKDARDLAGGHNVMVENPTAVWDWIASGLG